MKTLLLSLTLLFALAGCVASNGSAAFDQPQQDYNSIYNGGGQVE